MIKKVVKINYTDINSLVYFERRYMTKDGWSLCTVSVYINGQYVFKTNRQPGDRYTLISESICNKNYSVAGKPVHNDLFNALREEGISHDGETIWVSAKKDL